MYRNKALAILIAAIVCLAGCALATGRLEAQGKANLYYLRTKLFTPRPIEVQDTQGRRTAWFFKYTVANNSQVEVFFVPRITLTTEDNVVIRDTYDPAVLKAIKNLYGKEYANGVAAAKKLKPGESVEAVAVFPGMPVEADRLWIRIGGLTNEYYLKDPGTEKQKAVFRVYQQYYGRPGDTRQRSLDPLIEGAPSWEWEDTCPVEKEGNK